jgi:hypothetical protein
VLVEVAADPTRAAGSRSTGSRRDSYAASITL